MRRLKILDLIVIVAVVTICSVVVGPKIDAGFEAASGIIMWCLKWLFKIGAFFIVVLFLLVIDYLIRYYLKK